MSNIVYRNSRGSSPLCCREILGPIGFAKALADGTFPPTFGLTILTNDLIWWIPFALVL